VLETDARAIAGRQGDEQVTSRCEFVIWEYPTKWVELNLLGRIPRLQEIGRSLAGEISTTIRATDSAP